MSRYLLTLEAAHHIRSLLTEILDETEQAAEIELGIQQLFRKHMHGIVIDYRLEELLGKYEPTDQWLKHYVEGDLEDYLDQTYGNVTLLPTNYTNPPGTSTDPASQSLYICSKCGTSWSRPPGVDVIPACPCGGTMNPVVEKDTTETDDAGSGN